MKARIITMQRELNRAVKEQYIQYDTQAREETFIQAVAVFLTVLKQYRGHTNEYCKKIFDDINSKFKLMETGTFGQKSNVEDCVAFVKNEIGIDLEKEIKGDFKVNIKF